MQDGLSPWDRSRKTRGGGEFKTFAQYCTSIGLATPHIPCSNLLWDSVTLFFSLPHSSYRLDKINSDMHNYITNFAADLR